MKTTTAFLLAALSICAAPAFAADTMPAGTLITGTATGPATGLLGLDHLFADEAGTNTTALAADELEYLSKDYAVGIDFFTDGSVLFYNNAGSTLPGSYTLTFSFDAASPAITGFTLSDVSQITAGTITPQVLGAHSIGITFTDLNTAADYGTFTAQITTAAAVPEPSSPALLVGGLGLVAFSARRAARKAA